MLKKIIVGIMIISCLGMGGYLVFEYKNEDKNGPEITFAREELSYDANTDTESVLLSDVSAMDQVDGDVSDSLRIESVYQSNDEEAIVVYVARDKSNNISKRKRIIGYTALKEENISEKEENESEKEEK